MTPLRSLAVAGAGLLTASALTLAPASATSPMDAKPATYHQSDSGDTVRVAAGDTVRVVLKAAGGTGYSWRAVKPSSEAFTIVSRTEKSTNPGVPGGGVKVVFTLQAASKGTGVFKAQLRRSFGKDRIAKRFTLTLKVAGS